MPQCGHRAILVITESVEGTTTNVARDRMELECAKAADHEGPHHDPTHDETWEGAPDRITTLLRDVSEGAE